VGVLGFKAGMTADWDVWGVRRPLTVIQLDEAVVTAGSVVTRSLPPAMICSGNPCAPVKPRWSA
jgi:ribosomal protein L3